MTGLDASLTAGRLAAFVGALFGVLVLRGAELIEAAPDAPRAPADTRLAVGGFLLASHAVAAATLWQDPPIGSCMAASLGAGWLAASAAGLIGMVARYDHLKRRGFAAGMRAVLGFALLWPLWSYIEAMRLHALASAPV